VRRVRVNVCESSGASSPGLADWDEELLNSCRMFVVWCPVSSGVQLPSV